MNIKVGNFKVDNSLQERVLEGVRRDDLNLIGNRD